MRLHGLSRITLVLCAATLATMLWEQRALASSSFGPNESWSNMTFYGVQTLMGDVDGDGKADLVGLGNGYIGVLRSTGTSFGPYETWGGISFMGNIATFLADVNGDHRADLIAVSGAEFDVMLSTGSGFAAPQVWWVPPILPYLNVGIAFQPADQFEVGDVDGDGCADLIVEASGATNVAVALSSWCKNQTPSFENFTTWWPGTFLGQYGTFAGDVDGDGKADLVGCGPNYVGVIRSTGSGFGGYETWWGGTFFGGDGTFLTDVTGDGKADLVSLGPGYIGVIRSMGNTFGPYETWYGATFTGQYGTLIGDVVGNGYADLVGLDSGDIKLLPSSLTFSSAYFDNLEENAQAHLIVANDGAFDYSGNVHDYGLGSDDFVLDAYPTTLPAGSHGPVFNAQGQVWGGLNINPTRDANWHAIGTNPEIATNWAAINSGGMTFHIHLASDIGADIAAVAIDIGEAISYLFGSHCSNGQTTITTLEDHGPSPQMKKCTY